MVDFTLAICTYNGASRLPTLFDRLLAQENTDDFTWETIVVDNNSSDRTADIIRDYQPRFASICPIQYCFEPRQGLAFARRLVIREAAGELVGFLDDDNYPDRNWVAAAYHFGKKHPKAGGYGGRIFGKYDEPPPPNFEKIAPFLAVADRGSEACRYDLLGYWIFPPGAGMVVRHRAWLESVPDRPKLRGVSGKSLSNKGEDVETLSYIRKAGWEIWHNPDMILEHHIPASRFKEEYLRKLCRGVGLSRHATRTVYRPPWQHPFVTSAYWLSDGYKLIFHSLKNGKSLHQDLISRCQREILIGSLISPFYHLSKKIKADF